MNGLATFPVRDEDQIIRTWGRVDAPLVSICCATFNHVDYIEDAIRGFLAQETTFPFEIIIRDDASTDGTTDIVRKYSEGYPRLIRAVINPKNQFKNGARAMQIWPSLARGKYIAICEGDDFWISPHKLQKQFDALESSNVGLCFHKSAVLKNGVLKNSTYKYDSRLYSLDELVLNNFHFMQTNTLMYERSRVDERFISFLTGITVADFFLRFYAGINGAICINEQLGCYRALSHGSWSSGLKNDQKLKEFFLNYLRDIDNFDNFLSKKYSILLIRYRYKIFGAIASSRLSIASKFGLLLAKRDQLGLNRLLYYFAMAILKNRYLHIVKSWIKD